MSKILRKSLGMFLSIALVLSSFSAVTMTAFAEGPDHKTAVSEKFDFVEVTTGNADEPVADVMSDASGINLTKNNSALILDFATVKAADNSRDTEQSFTIANEKAAKLFNGQTGSAEEFSYIAGFVRDLPNKDPRSEMAMFDTVSGNYYARTDRAFYVDMTLDLSASYELTGILLNSANVDSIGDYDLFVGNDKATLFDTAVATYAIDKDFWLTTKPTDKERSTLGKTKWLLKEGKSVQARYIGVRIYIVNTRYPQNGGNAKYYFDRIRLNEFAVYGKPTNQASVETDISKVSGLADKVNSDSNLVKGFAQSESGAKKTFTAYAYDGSDEKVIAADSKYSTLTNGSYTDSAVTFSAPKFITGTEYNGNYAKLVFSLPTAKEITNILVATDEATPVSAYEIYLSNSKNSLFNDSSISQMYDNDNASSAQYFTFNTSKTAKYVGIKFTKGCAKTVAEDNSYLSLKEIAIIGVNTEDIIKEITDEELIASCKADYSTEKNLLNYDVCEYAVRQDKTPGSFYVFGMLEGTPATSVGSLNTHVPTNDMLDGDYSTHVDTSVVVSGNRIVYQKNNDGALTEYNENTYIDIAACLLHPATIDRIFLAWPQGYPTCRPQAYEIYASDVSFDELYKEESCVLKVDGLKDSAVTQFQAIEFPTPITAKFVGLRITKGIQDSYSLGKGNSYARIAEFGIFGKYECNYFDYTGKSYVVDHESTDYLDVSGNAYDGREITFTANLVNDIYAFTSWKVNGEIKEGEVDTAKGITKITVPITQKTEVLAVYDYATKNITSDNFIIDHNKKFISVPAKTFKMLFVKQFDNFEQYLLVKNGDNDVEDVERVVTGMTVTQKDIPGTETLEVVTSGDTDLNGKLNVTDIVASFDVALGKDAESEKSFFAIDTNGNGKVTVSDLIATRNAIVNDDAKDKYERNTYKASELDYKYIGRKFYQNEEICLDMTASGFEFNANMIGDLTLTVRSPISMYFTVTLDGEVLTQDAYAEVFAVDVPTEVTLARDIPAGNHTIGIYKQLEGGKVIRIKDISFYGENTGKPADNPKLIDFVGDSITCGAGNMMEGGSLSNVDRHENGYMSYAPQTARLLGYDYACISNSGSTLIKGETNNPMPVLYEALSTNQRGTPYDFEHNRHADIVVVNLGTNDRGRAEFTSNFQKEAEEFARRLIELHGNDTLIVFCYGMMSHINGQYPDDAVTLAYKAVAEKLTGEGYRVYYKDLPSDTTGGSSHPTIKGDTEAAKVLADFIKSVEK